MQLVVNEEKEVPCPCLIVPWSFCTCVQTETEEEEEETAAEEELLQRAHQAEIVTKDTYTAGQRALLQLLQMQRAQPLVAASSCSDSIESLFSHPHLSPLRESLSSSLVLLSLLQREEDEAATAARTHLRMQHVCRW